MLKIELITITNNTICIGNLQKSITNIFNPTKINLKASPFYKYQNLSIIPVSGKYEERKPCMAYTFQVWTIKCSCVEASITRMLSAEKIKSVVSIKTKTKNKDVANGFPSCFIKIFHSCISLLTGIALLNNFYREFFLTQLLPLFV